MIEGFVVTTRRRSRASEPQPSKYVRRLAAVRLPRVGGAEESSGATGDARRFRRASSASREAKLHAPRLSRMRADSDEAIEFFLGTAQSNRRFARLLDTRRDHARARIG